MKQISRVAVMAVVLSFGNSAIAVAAEIKLSAIFEVKKDNATFEIDAPDADAALAAFEIYYTPQVAFETRIPPDQEPAFQAWKAVNALLPSGDLDSGADYDYHGAFLAGVKPDPVTGRWPETFKKPNHPTFSDQSKYAQYGTPGHWSGDRYVPAVATAADMAAPAVAAQGTSDAFIRRIASTAALSSLILGAFLSFLIFRFTAYRYWKKVRVTAIQNGIWFGGIFASMAPYPVMNKMARDGFSEIPLQLVVTTFLFFTLAFACGYAWRKFKAAPNPTQSHNEDSTSDPALRQQAFDASVRHQLFYVGNANGEPEIEQNRPVDVLAEAPNPAQPHSEETKIMVSGEIKMNALLLRPSLLAGVAGFLVPILLKPYGPIAFSRLPLSTWFDRGDGLIMCFAGAIAAFALVEMYQRLRKP